VVTRKKPAPKRGASRYQAPAKKPVPGWLLLVAGLVIGGFLVFLATLQPGGDEIKRNQEAAKSKEPPKRAASQDPAAKPKYDFYTLLPESEVILPPEAKQPPTPAPVSPEEAARIDAARAEAALNGQTPPPPPPTIATAPVTQFFLQAGSFRKQADADKLRAEIIMLGQDVRVEGVKVRDENWYRVLVGPYTSREQLNQAQKTLAASGYSNLLLQQRQAR
jgi:cell division protein FtsN